MAGFQRYDNTHEGGIPGSWSSFSQTAHVALKFPVAKPLPRNRNFCLSIAEKEWVFSSPHQPHLEGHHSWRCGFAEFALFAPSPGISRTPSHWAPETPQGQGARFPNLRFSASLTGVGLAGASPRAIPFCTRGLRKFRPPAPEARLRSQTSLLGLTATSIPTRHLHRHRPVLANWFPIRTSCNISSQLSR